MYLYLFTEFVAVLETVEKYLSFLGKNEKLWKIFKNTLKSNLKNKALLENKAPTFFCKSPNIAVGK